MQTFKKLDKILLQEGRWEERTDGEKEKERDTLKGRNGKASKSSETRMTLESKSLPYFLLTPVFQNVHLSRLEILLALMCKYFRKLIISQSTPTIVTLGFRKVHLTDLSASTLPLIQSIFNTVA